MKLDPRDEFSEFMADENRREIPKKFQTQLLARVKVRIQPSLKDTLPKFLFAQAAAALATLSVCPQFGIGPMTSGHGIGHLFMRFGEAGCAAFCGAFFLATGTLVAALLLRRGERREIMRYRFRIIGAVSMICFLTFMGVGKGLDLPMIFDSTIAYISWFLGALLSSLMILQMVKFASSLSQSYQK